MCLRDSRERDREGEKREKERRERREKERKREERGERRGDARRDREICHLHSGQSVDEQWTLQWTIKKTVSFQEWTLNLSGEVSYITLPLRFNVHC